METLIVPGPDIRRWGTPAEHDVILEGESGFYLLLSIGRDRALTVDLKTVRVSENIVPEDIIFSVMMVKPVVGIIDEVVFCEDARRALIEIDPPAAVSAFRAGDVVDAIEPDNGSWRKPKRVDPAQIAEDALPDLVDMV